MTKTKSCRTNNKITKCNSKPINDASHTGWTTNGHTGVDVNTYAYGPGSNKFKGNMENTQSAKTYLTFRRQCNIKSKLVIKFKFNIIRKGQSSS